MRCGPASRARTSDSRPRTRTPSTSRPVGEAFDPCEHPPPRPDDDVAESDRGVGGEGEVQRRVHVRQLLRAPEDDGPEADLDQMSQDDAYEEAEEERDAKVRAPGLEDSTDAR